ncbi:MULTISPECIES: nitrate/nitrite transporter NrtS [unclassified Iodidimonas]|jgi:hypothetical protein|uniref:nitrate/nitrite transporter NrtS n=1 Tax=unclassified Iodidimonas TaxID=2626145 RepID=UPI0024821DCF|nr:MULTISPECIES: nitrate/nitrite transporter NrtS [unclassified Iodidimonas]
MNSNAQPMTLFEALRLRSVVNRGLKVALIVGVILVLINQGELLLKGEMPPLWKVIMTFIVPYCVSSYSGAAHIVAQSRMQAAKPEPR